MFKTSFLKHGRLGLVTESKYPEGVSVLKWSHIFLQQSRIGLPKAIGGGVKGVLYLF
ncbi:MAG: hypothetical protein NDF52_09325 [archaeon YNP-WB-062]|jgi:hypothetical protein|nr:hypothetical protein [Candidatus Culexarchaeum yellowstonense]